MLQVKCFLFLNRLMPHTCHMCVRETGSVQSDGTMSVDREDWKRSPGSHGNSFCICGLVLSVTHCTGSDSLTAHSLLLKSSNRWRPLRIPPLQTLCHRQNLTRIVCLTLPTILHGRALCRTTFLPVTICFTLILLCN